MHIGTKLVRSQGISVTTVVRFVAAADTGRFERAEDGERVGVCSALLAWFSTWQICKEGSRRIAVPRDHT